MSGCLVTKQQEAWNESRHHDFCFFFGEKEREVCSRFLMESCKPIWFHFYVERLMKKHTLKDCEHAVHWMYSSYTTIQKTFQQLFVLTRFCFSFQLLIFKQDSSNTLPQEPSSCLKQIKFIQTFTRSFTGLFKPVLLRNHWVFLSSCWDGGVKGVNGTQYTAIIKHKFTCSQSQRSPSDMSTPG